MAPLLVIRDERLRRAGAWVCVGGCDLQKGRSCTLA